VNPNVRIDHSIIAFSRGASSVACLSAQPPAIECCDIYGNEGGDWVECIADQLDGSNIQADPLFCGDPDRPYALQPSSPCSEENSECGAMGAWPAGCGATDVGNDPASHGETLTLSVRPNPFTRSASIRLTLPERSPVGLRIVDVAGRTVRTLLDDSEQTAGNHGYEWDGRDDNGRAVASGIYFCHMETKSDRRIQRLSIVK
jgi:hypothetical protein